MENKLLKRCKVCGTEYEACVSCEKKHSWRVHTDIGAIINSGLISKVDALGEKVDGIEKRFEKHEASVAESKADERRADILRFNREIIRGLPHTMEDFIEVLSYIDFYESYCRDHPEYENNRAVMAIQNIEEAYQEHLRKNDFS